MKGLNTAITILLLGLVTAAIAIEPVTFKTVLTPPVGKTQRGLLKITVAPASGIHVSSGGCPTTFRITAPKELKFDRTRYEDSKEFSKPRTFQFGYRQLRRLTADSKIKVDVSYVYCEEDSDRCSFASKTLMVAVPKTRK